MPPERIVRQPRRESGFMSRRQVAEEFGFSVGFLNVLPQTELPFFKRGGKVFYERATVIAWIKGETPDTAPEDTDPPARSKGRPSKPVLCDPKSKPKRFAETAATAAGTL